MEHVIIKLVDGVVICDCGGETTKFYNDFGELFCLIGCGEHTNLIQTGICCIDDTHTNYSDVIDYLMGEHDERGEICDWCGLVIEGQSYYANGNQEGHLCRQCHIREMMGSDDTY